MNLLLPRIYTLMVNLMTDPTEQSVLLQKQILKIYHALTQFCLSLDLISQDVFAHWMEICRQVVERPAPDSSHVLEEERPDLPWWKVKKWALHILARMFERYGSPGNVVSKEYQSFAEWYLPTFTNGILQAMLKVLDQYRNNIYVSPRVLTEILNYIKTWWVGIHFCFFQFTDGKCSSVLHAYSWKLIKPHIPAIIQDVIFPIMSHTEADQAQWDSDPYEYIRLKFGECLWYYVFVSSYIGGISKKRTQTSAVNLQKQLLEPEEVKFIRWLWLFVGFL